MFNRILVVLRTTDAAHPALPDALLIPDSVRLFLTTGMMGGLTTDSTFSYETVRLIETNAWHQTWITIFVATTIALSLCFLGIAVGCLVLTLRG